MKIYGHRVPAYGLWAYQKPTENKPARYLWVEDIRTCGYTAFRICALNCVTCEKYTWVANVQRDSIARLFAKFADSLPLANIRRPLYDTKADFEQVGPNARKPQGFDARRAKPDNKRAMTDKSVVDGAKVGPIKVSEVGYYTHVLNMERVQY